MTTTTIRVSIRTRKTLHALAEASGASMQQVIDRALELYRRQQLLLNTNAAYARLRQQENEWNDYQTELKEWDETITDGLKDW
jgi:predicted transcriptional regulator